MWYNFPPGSEHLVQSASTINPSRIIGNWYDLLSDPFQVIKEKCKPTHPKEWIECKIDEICYLASEFSLDKIESPSFASPEDKVLNNLILDSQGRLLQLYFASNRSIEDLWSGFFKIIVTEYRSGWEVVARKFESHLS